MRSCNFRVRHLPSGQECGHHHHSRDTALRCLEVSGLDPEECVIEEFMDGQDRKKSLHRSRKRGRREAEW